MKSEKCSAEAEKELAERAFFLERYENHLRAVKFARATKEKLQDRIEEMTANYRAGKRKPGQIEPSKLEAYLMPAVDTVIECRRLLAWTYPIGFYMPNDFGNKTLFTNLQAKLEEFTHNLHELCETDSDSQKLTPEELRTEIINYTRCTKRFRDNMVNGVEELIARTEEGAEVFYTLEK